VGAIADARSGPAGRRSRIGSRRAVLEGSRIAVTEQLVRAMAEANSRPRVFISGSAVGYYGDRTDELLTEASSPADDFLARPCRRWECAVQEADRLGARVVLLRTGVVLDRAGGALAQVVPPFQLGVGGPVGSGKQYLPWLHLHDLVKIHRDRDFDPFEKFLELPVIHP
jgi:uncharacterized protein (TIGR01777 family)